MAYSGRSRRENFDQLGWVVMGHVSGAIAFRYLPSTQFSLPHLPYTA